MRIFQPSRALLLLFVIFASSQLNAARRAKPAAKPEVKPAEPTVVETTIRPAEVDYSLSKIYRYKINFSLGLGVVDGSSLVTGAQFGFSPFERTPVYLGPEINFLLFSPGSIFSTLLGGWYEMRIEGAPNLAISLGVAAGPAFPSFISRLTSTSLAIFGDASISQDIDDLVTIRGQFRPGIIGRLFSFTMAFNLCFRFS